MNAPSASPDGLVAVGTLAVVGVGLIGGSFAAALRRAGLVGRVIGAGRRPETLAQAMSLGVIDEAVTLTEAARQADFIFIAAPVGAFAPIFNALGPELNPDALITDGGSTKQNVIVCARAGLKDRIAQVVPAHPMAGSHESGPAAASADLYAGRRVMLTPLAENRPQDVSRVQALWQACGAVVSTLDPAQHDAVMASISHLPHWLAAFYMRHILQSDDIALRLAMAGPGFRDFTRIAQGSPEMWRDIFLANREAMLGELSALRGVMDQAEQALLNHDGTWLQDALQEAARARSDWTGTGS